MAYYSEPSKLQLAIERYFKIPERNSTIGTEVRAGVTTFLAMVYIVPVNAAIMSLTGMPFDALITATAVVTIISTILNGLWSNTPVAMSVGMGLNAYFTFGLVKGMGLPWQTALGIVMLSGLFFLLLSGTRFRAWVIEMVPLDLRRAIGVGIGFFIASIGLEGMGVFKGDPHLIVTLGNLKEPAVVVGVLTTLLALILHHRRVKGAILIGILAGAIVGWFLGLAHFPKGIFELPASLSPIAFKFDLEGALAPALLPVVLTFFATDLFDTIGTLAGIGIRAGLFTDGTESLQRTLEVDAAATVLGASLGTSTTTSFIESLAGVEEGGRTGLTAVVTGLLFVTTLFFLPIYRAIPEPAIYGALVAVGILMVSELRNIDLGDLPTATATFLMILMMPMTHSITLGLSGGFLAYLILLAGTGQWDRINIGILVIGAIGAMAFLFH
jgi:AGZA family xanthine/uracil permease-like MFS transporter